MSLDIMKMDTGIGNKVVNENMTAASAMEVDDGHSVPPYLTDLFSEDSQKLHYAVEKLKNTVIGSNRQKASAIRNGVLPRVLNLLSDNGTKVEIRRDACIILGSLVKGTTENVRVVVNADAVPKLIEVLAFPDEKLVEFSLSCLTTIFSHSFCQSSILFSDASLIRHLLTLMNQSVANQISVATILAHSCTTEEQQVILCQSGVIEHLTVLLSSSNVKVQMSAVKCLTALSYKNENVAAVIVTTTLRDRTIPDLLILLIGRDKSTKMQLNVAKCLTNLHRANALPSTDSKICMKTLGCLVRMCGKDQDVESRILAAETLAYLIEIDKELQATAAISSHLIPTLADYLKSHSLMFKMNTNTVASMSTAALLGLASLAANDELIRKKIIETDNVMEKVVTNLEDDNEAVTLAAVKCLHSLSRSVQQLRTTFKDHSVWKPLLKLLNHGNQDIRNVAASTLCNLLLEFSPSKEPILEAGALDILSGLTRHEDSQLRINGVWALMNVAFQADQRVKSQVVSCIGTEQIFKLLSDDDDNVIMKTLGLLRNLLSPAVDIDYIMSLYGAQIMQASNLTLENEHSAEVKEQVLCMLANIADGVTGKEFIMSNDEVLKKIANYLVDPNSKLQVGAVLCVTHLAWKEEDGSAERQAKLKEMGVPTLLHQLITAGDNYLFDRVKTALNQFSPN